MHGRLPLAFVAGALAVGVPVTLAADPAPTAKREDLALHAGPTGAKTRALGLTRVTVPAGVTLDWHTHPGTQIASIQSGTLTYSVARGGSVRVMGGDAAKAPRVVRTIRPGQTGVIRKGEWIVEPTGMVHRGANRGTTDVVILLSTLFPKGAPTSSPAAP